MSSVGVAKLHVNPASWEVAIQILPTIELGRNKTRTVSWAVTNGTGCIIPKGVPDKWIGPCFAHVRPASAVTYTQPHILSALKRKKIDTTLIVGLQKELSTVYVTFLTTDDHDTNYRNIVA